MRGQVKTIYQSTGLMLTVAYLLAMYPADLTIRACVCRLHGSDCPCCIASVSHSIRVSQCVQEGHHNMDCGIEMPPAKEAAKLFGFCRCKEAKKVYAPPSMAVVVRSGMIVMLVEGSETICWKEGQTLPGYEIPPMKPPPAT